MKQLIPIVLITIGFLVSDAGGQSRLEEFDRIDRDNNGEITRTESGEVAWFERALLRLDRNEDGVLQRIEVEGVALAASKAET